MKKTTLVTGRIVFGSGAPRILTDEGKTLELMDFMPKYNKRAMEYDSETGWFQSPRIRFQVEVETKQI